MGNVVGLIALVLNVVAIIDCVKSAMDTGKKALWIILILILPFLGVILYFLVGKKK